MSKVLATFSGKNGDILWSLPTVREIAWRHGGAVDFGIMPQYKNLLPLLNLQPYIAKAFTIDNWIITGSPHGDQPWEAPRVDGYEVVHHLTYKQHPGWGCPALPLCDFTAWQQGITLRTPVVPFITCDPIDIFPPPPEPVIPYGFNGDFFDLKQQFLCRLTLRTAGLLGWVDVSTLPFEQVASLIAQAGIYVGCRSACWVIAMGVGARVIVYEPNHARHAEGPFGKVFGCPYGREEPLMFQQTPQQAGDQAAEKVLAWRDQYWSREKKGERAIV